MHTFEVHAHPKCVKPCRDSRRGYSPTRCCIISSIIQHQVGEYRERLNKKRKKIIKINTLVVRFSPFL